LWLEVFAIAAVGKLVLCSTQKLGSVPFARSFIARGAVPRLG
jgi:hypothetical protein